MVKKRKKIKRLPRGKIEAGHAYTTSQVVGLLGIHPIKARSLAKDLQAKRVSKEYLVMGENLLRYLGSASYKEK